MAARGSTPVSCGCVRRAAGALRRASMGDRRSPLLDAAEAASMRFSRASIAARAAVMSRPSSRSWGEGAGLEHLQRRTEGDVQVDVAEIRQLHVDRVQQLLGFCVEALGGEAGAADLVEAAANGLGIRENRLCPERLDALKPRRATECRTCGEAKANENRAVHPSLPGVRSGHEHHAEPAHRPAGPGPRMGRHRLLNDRRRAPRRESRGAAEARAAEARRGLPGEALPMAVASKPTVSTRPISRVLLGVGRAGAGRGRSDRSP